MKPEHVLVVVDDTETSKRAVRYAGRILAGCHHIDIHLAFITTSLPPELLESGGSESPEQEERLNAELHERQRRWIAVAEKTPEAILDDARDLLRGAGVDDGRVSTCVSSPLDARSEADEILLLARDEQCQTVVVGYRPSKGEEKKLVQGLIQGSEGRAIWIVD